jgi:predicted secreted hydrolase
LTDWQNNGGRWMGPIAAKPAGGRTVGMRLLILALAAWCCCAAAWAQDYRSVTGPCDLQFPRDHGAHPEYRTEWWYYTGNLTGGNADRFGYQLTVFRNRIAPPGETADWPRQPSAWRTHQIYMAHLAISDLSGKRHRFADRMARGAVGLADVRLVDGRVAIQVADWAIEIQPGQHHLTAATPALDLALTLQPLKPLVRHGQDGFSRKGAGRGEASCYTSFTRMATAGTITVDGRSHTVSGLSWMDHEYSTAVLPAGTVGWDWFSLQLSDGRDLMLFQLRSSEAGRAVWTAGTLVAIDGSHRDLDAGGIRLDALSSWKSPHSKARYPIRWRLTLQDPPAELELTALLADQEMRPSGSVPVIYWEGSIGIAGTVSGRPVDGSGYAELTGYAHPMTVYLSPDGPP